MKEFKQFDPMKISFEDPIYTIREDDRVVECKLVGNVKWPMYGSDEAFNFQISHVHQKVEVTAYAKCHEDDEFSVTRGKDIARQRAETKAYAKLYKETHKYLHALCRYVDIINDFRYKSVFVMDRSYLFEQMYKKS